jgi:sigma-B regulation protein RsbU (phosphoserine phosphatase)
MLVRELNQRFFREDGTDYFTMFCGLLDLRTGTMTYCQAGAPSPFLIARDGTTMTVGDGGYPVGLLLSLDFENGTVPFDAGGALVLYSDGATEAETAGGVPYGEDRLKEFVTLTAARGVAEIPQAVVESLSVWREGAQLEDDLTVFTLERNTPK